MVNNLGMQKLFTSYHKIALSVLLSILIMTYTTSCIYYRARIVQDNFPTIKEIGQVHQMFYVHLGELVYGLENISVDKSALYGNLIILDHEPYYYEGRKYIVKEQDKDILNEVHIYMNNDISFIELGETSIPLSTIHEIRVINQDAGKTLLAFVGTALLMFILITIIVFLTKSSCPYVYVHDGEDFAFVGETFGGAIGQNMERDDYLPLPGINGVDGKYKVRISNELKEMQYTDLAHLLVCQYDKSQKVLLDARGQPHVFDNPEAPLNAFAGNGKNISSLIKSKDSMVYFFNENQEEDNSVRLKFRRSESDGDAKLVFTAKNSLWADYLLGVVFEKFGYAFNRFMDQQADVPTAERLQNYYDHKLPLSIYIKTKDKWQLVEHIMTIGPLAQRDFIVPLNLTDHDYEFIEIKMETGFLFWELDWVGIDFTRNDSIDLWRLEPELAFGSHDMDWTNALQQADMVYMNQLETGDITELEYAIPNLNPQKAQSIFLHTRGYYTLVRDFKGIAQRAELEQLRTPGKLSEFSRNRYYQMLYPDVEIASLAQEDNL